MNPHVEKLRQVQKNIEEIRNEYFTMLHKVRVVYEEKIQQIANPVEWTRKIDDFWMKVIENSELGFEYLEPEDMDSLLYLEDVRVSSFLEEEDKGFTIEFQFKSNPYFRNEVLTKSYLYHEEIEGDIVDISGTEIDWISPENNLTLELYTKKQRNKATKQTRVVKKSRPKDSFYKFFDTKISEDEEEAKEIFSRDRKLGMLLRDIIIPKAIFYYTSERTYDTENDDDLKTEEVDVSKLGMTQEEVMELLADQGVGKNKSLVE